MKDPNEIETNNKLPLWFTGLLPLVLLGLLVYVFFLTGPASVFQAAFPPIEELTIDRIVLKPNEMIVHVVNGGPEAVTIAQVLVDEAYWQHTIEPARTVPRLATVKIYIPYPWVEGETHEVTLITRNGVTFSKEVEIAVESPEPNVRYFWTFVLLGTYVGIIPVFLGLLWFPFLQKLSDKWLNFFLSLTVGLLIFLGIDALDEAFEIADQVAGAFQGVGLIGLGFLISFLGLQAVSKNQHGQADTLSKVSHLWVAYMIALGIGLHNLGEGLAIGTAYSLGEIALGTFLVIGFTLHNITEGLAIVVPIAKERPQLWHFAAMGAVAGVPTIFGTWIGGFSYSPVLSTLFLSIGAGAIFQVVYIIGKLMLQEIKEGFTTLLNFTGLALGMIIMDATALFVVR